MADEIHIDGLEELAFRRSIETMLRHGEAEQAASRLKALLAPYAGNGAILPARILEVDSGDITLAGWDDLAQHIRDYDRPENRITALGIGIADPEDWGVSPDDEGRLTPPLETTYFTDAAYPFSEADRADLLEGYSTFGCEWQGDFDHTDKVLTIEGIDDLYGAIAELENQVSQSAHPSPRDIEAGAIGACYLGVLVFQATRDAILSKGLPRPLTVLLVNSDAYPFFDAPVMSRDEFEETGAAETGTRPIRETSDEDDEMAEEAEDDGGFASLGSLLGAPAQKARKTPVLVLEADEAANPLGMEDEAVALAAFEARTLAGNDEFPSLDYADTAFAPSNGGDVRLGGGPQFEDDETFEDEQALLDEEGRNGSDWPSPVAEDKPRRKTPIDLGAPFDNVSPIDFGAPLGDTPEDIQDGEPAAPKENWLDDWREITQAPYDPGSEPADNNQNAAPRERWLDDWREITERPNAEETGSAPHNEPAGGDAIDGDETGNSGDAGASGPAPDAADGFDLHMLEEDIAAARPGDAYEEAPIPGAAWHSAGIARPATHSIRDRIRASAQQDMELPAPPNIWSRIVILAKRAVEWITRS